MKKLSLAILCLLLIVAFSACGDNKEKQEKTVSDTYISKSEAEIFFLEITGQYRFELMTKDEETLKSGVSPEFWPGIAEEVCECNISEIPAEYINDAERTMLTTAYGANAANNVFSIYRIADLQRGIDSLFGKGKYDVSAWSKNNIDILNNNTFGTAAGYFIFSKTETESFDTQVYKIISVTGGDGKATVKAYALDIDNISGNMAYDLAVTDQKTDSWGNTISEYKVLENAAVTNYDFAADFDTNLANMGISQEGLGTVQFVFGIQGINMYLDHIACN